MFKKTLKTLSLLTILSLAANANDLLAEITNNAISDNSLGVKVLNQEQMSKVRGGYILSSVLQYNGMAFVLAIPDPITELGVDLPNLRKYHGVCPLGQTQCYANPSTREHIDRNQGRLVDYWQALGGRTVTGHVLLYGIKNINVGNGAMAPTTHVYAVEKKYLNMPQHWFDHETTDSFQLEYNQVLREIKKAVGTDLIRLAR